MSRSSRIRVIPYDLEDAAGPTDINLHFVAFPEELFSRARSFWQHTGWGISSRLSDFSLKQLMSSDGGPKNTMGESISVAIATAQEAKQMLRERIASVLKRDVDYVSPMSQYLDVAPGDVFLFPSGMSAIWTAHQLALGTRPAGKSVCFGQVIVYGVMKAFVITKKLQVWIY